VVWCSVTASAPSIRFRHAVDTHHSQQMRLVFRASPVGLRNRRRRGDRLAADGELWSIAAQSASTAKQGSSRCVAVVRIIWSSARTCSSGKGPSPGGDAYASAGADSLFVPGLIELDTLCTLVKESPLPINVRVWPGAPTVAELSAIGVRRISVGTAIAQAAYGVAHRAAVELLTKGTYDALAGGLDFSVINSAVTR
jgi:Phosphoenolpyruvate phosphomutase